MREKSKSLPIWNAGDGFQKRWANIMLIINIPEYKLRTVFKATPRERIT